MLFDIIFDAVLYKIAHLVKVPETSRTNEIFIPFEDIRNNGQPPGQANDAYNVFPEDFADFDKF